MRTFHCQSQGAVSSRQNVWLRVFRGDHCHRHDVCRRRGGRKLRPDVRFRGVGIVQGAYAQCALATCSLTTLKPFSSSLGKVGSIPIVGETSLQCLQRQAFLGLETHGCRVDSLGWYGSHWCPTGQSSRHKNFDYFATREVIGF